MAHSLISSISLAPLDPNLVTAKPISSCNEKVINELGVSGNLIITRKRDGHNMLVSITGRGNGGVRLYTRGILEITDKYPHIVKDVRNCDFPAGTLLSGEIIFEKEGKESRETFQRFASSGVKKALALQEEIGHPKFAIFNVIVFDGDICVYDAFETRMSLVQTILAGHSSEYTSIVEILDMPFTKAKEVVVKNGWEGLVLYDRNAGSEIRLDGNISNTPRPVGCWKWKPVNEDDFVAIGWVPSTSAKHKGAVKDLIIVQYDQNGKEIACGKVGTGLSKAARVKYANDDLYPMVFEVKFERRGEKTNKLISARIVRKRHDKSPKECVFVTG